MTQKTDFQAVFDGLKSLLEPHAGRLLVKADEVGNYYLEIPYSDRYKREVFFGAAQVKKNYVSFHLMPVYLFPDLLDDLPELLDKRMQGKSCFNFKTLDEDQRVALEALVARCVSRLETEKLL